MKIKKLAWISALVLLISLPLAFAQSIFDAPIFSNSLFILIVNIKIVFFILFILQAFILPKKEGKEKVAIWVICYGLAVLIVLTIGGRGEGYIWQVGNIASLFSIRKFVNFVLIGGIAWFGFGLAGIDVNKTKYAMVGFILLALLIAGGIANSIGDKWLWDTNNFKATKDFLLAPDHRDTFRGKAIIAGGILRPEGPPAGQYRLFIFLGSAVLWSWFFSTFLKIDNSKLSYAIAILIAAIQAWKGTPVGTVIALAEAFFLLLVYKQMGAGGGVTGFFQVAIAILLVEFVFCSVFGTSALYTFLGDTLGEFTVGAKDPNSWAHIGKPFSFLKTTDPCSVVAKISGIPPLAPPKEGAEAPPPPPPPPPPASSSDFWKWLASVAAIAFPPLGWYLWKKWHP